MKAIQLVICICMLTAVGVCNAQAHPSDGWTPGDLDPAYGTPSLGWSSDHNWGEFTFSSPLPNPAFLTDAEKYMLAGTKESNIGPEGNGLLPWIDQIVGIARLCQMRNGYIPGRLNADEFAKAAQTESILLDPLLLDIIRSPITNDFPQLNAAQFSPGNMYIKVLDEEQVNHFAQYLPTLQEILQTGSVWNEEAGYRESVVLSGPVMYVRVYGQSQVIYSSIVFSTTHSN